MDLVISLTTGNDAFWGTDPDGNRVPDHAARVAETTRILLDMLRGGFRSGEPGGSLRDVNGNTVGEWRWTEID